MRAPKLTNEEVIDTSRGADLVRQECANDLKYFYLNVLDTTKRGLGKVHDFVLDFLRLEDADKLETKYKHSCLFHYLPEKVGNKFNERWLYFKSIGEVPEIQDGPDGPISVMFHEKTWQGIIFRIAGNGLRKAVLLPRGHLKTELCVKSHVLWRIIRNPSERCLLFSSTDTLACTILSDIKYNFEGNEQFQKLFGYLGPPPKGTGLWTQNAIRVHSKQRTGKEPSLMSRGLSSEATGFHCDYMIFDDVVAEQNSGTKEMRDKGRHCVQRLCFVRDPGSGLLDVGTTWADDDTHGMFIRKDSPTYAGTSFVVATVVDAYDRPICPEIFTPEVIEEKRSECIDDYSWACQYFNQPRRGSTSSFNQDWLKWYDNKKTSPEEQVKAQKLDVYMTVDPANSERKDSDYSSCCVVGQTQNGQYRYILDGFRERLNDADLPIRIVDYIEHWQEVARLAGTSFRFAIETFSFQKYIKHPLRDEMRKRGVVAAMEEVEPHGRVKVDRIRRLAAPFSTGSYYLPEAMFKSGRDGRSYNFIADLREEFIRFPHGTHDDILDSLAYVEELIHPIDTVKYAVPAPEEFKPREPNKYSRDQALKEYKQEQSAGKRINTLYNRDPSAYRRSMLGRYQGLRPRF